MFKLIMRNTGSNVLVLLVKIIITLIMTPIFVHALGNHDYGVWEVVFAVVGYMGLLDMGMKPAIIRYVAKYNAEGDRVLLDELYSTAFLFMLAVGCLMLLVFSVWALYWPELLSADGGSHQRYALLLAIIAIELLFAFPGYVAESFFQGFQKYSLINSITIFNSILGAILLYNYIDAFDAIVVLALVNAAGITAKYLTYFCLLATKKHGRFRLSFQACNMAMMKRLFAFGIKSFIQGVAHRIEAGSAPLIISMFMGPAYVIFYAIPASLARYLQTLGWTITQVFLPIFSELCGKNDTVATREIYLLYSRYIVAALLPLAVLAFFLGGDFISLWVGEEYVQGSMVLQVMVIYYMLPFINPFSSRYLMAVNKHGLLAKVYPVVAVANLIVSIILINSIGVEGVAIGALLPICISVPFLIYFICKDIGVAIVDYANAVIVPSAIPFFSMIICLLVLKQSYLVGSYFDLVWITILASFVYALLSFFWVLSHDERINLKNKFVAYIR